MPPNRVAELMWKATGIRKTGDQCRTRWTKVDNPSITKGSWSQHEDDLLATAVKERTTGDSPPPWVAVSVCERETAGAGTGEGEGEGRRIAPERALTCGRLQAAAAAVCIHAGA